MNAILVGLLAMVTLLKASIACADDYPTRAIELVVPFSPGGGTDLTARLLAIQLTDMLKQNVIVVNRPGGSGMVGAEMVSSAKPDGYTLLYSAGAMAFVPFTVPHMSFNVEQDLTPITLTTQNPYVVVVNKIIPADNPKQLGQYIKAHERNFSWGVSTVGGPDHFAIGLFDSMAGVKPLIVPYNGSGPAFTALLGDEVQGVMANPGITKSQLGSGKVKALAVTTRERSSMMPDLPTIGSFGFEGYEASGWDAVWGPKGMDAALAKKIHGYFVKALASPVIKLKFVANGVSPAASASPEAFAAFFKGEISTNASIVKGLELESRK